MVQQLQRKNSGQGMRRVNHIDEQTDGEESDEEQLVF